SMEVVGGRVLSAHVVLAQSRSLIVDFLQICGMSRESALAVLAPTSATPAYPPEVWEE
ncbi:FUSC family protein, partial [Corynebacterium mastitidis]